jgi:uncharacterized membrane protein
MPKSKTEILINTDIERCWKFILDLKNIGLSLDILDEVKDLENESALWILKTQQATITKTKSVKASIKLKEPYKKVIWEALGENLSINGLIELESIAKDRTKAIIELDMEVKGPLGIILNPIISTMINSRVETFSKSIKNKLENE